MCQFLIIDDKFMLGLRQLHWLESRLCQIFPSSTQFFGGINVLLPRDFGQLSPFGERNLYDKERCIKRVVNTIVRHQLYQLFNKTTILT